MLSAVPLSTLAATANGGFETGTLSGWTATSGLNNGSVSVQQTISALDNHGVPVTVYNAEEGNFFAVLYPGDPGIPVTTLSQTFTAAAGDIISGWALFISEDEMPYNDAGQVVIEDSSGAEIATVFNASVGTVGSIGSSTGWTKWTYTFSTPGTYVVQAQVANVGLPGYSSILAIDGVNITGTTLPTANAGGSYSVDEGSVVTLHGTGTDPYGGAVTYSWDLNNDGTFETTGQNPIFSAANIAGPATQTVVLKVTTSTGLTATSTATVTINNVVPTVDAGLDAYVVSGSYFHATGTLFHPDTTVCTATADWGDGSPPEIVFSGTPSGGSASFQLFHPYNLPNGLSTQTYTVTVTVDDGHGGVGTGVVHVDVISPTRGPVIDPISIPSTVIVGQTVTFNVIAEDPQQLPVTITASGLPAGAVFTTSGGISGTAQYESTFTWTPTWSDASPTPYLINFTATSTSTLTATAVAILLVNPAPPVANAGGPYYIYLGNGVTLDASGSLSTGAAHGVTIVNYAWDVNNDGIYELSGQTVPLTAAELAAYGLPAGVALPIGLQITDSNGLTATASTTLTITALNIHASAGANGTISPSGTLIINYGASQAFNITPNINYHIADVKIDGVSVGPVTNYTFNGVVSNHSIAASFAINTFTINASSDANGSVSPSGSVTVNYGTSPTFTITPNDGYHIADVLVNGTSVGAVSSYTFNNVVANQTISATFAIDTFTINASSDANGTISPAGTLTLNYGSSQTYTITPIDGYYVADVQVDGISVGAPSSYTFNQISASHTIAVSFSLTKTVFTINASAGNNGTISPSGAIAVEYESSQTSNITPNEGYHVAQVLVDGVPVGAVTSYTFDNVIANHTISASFAINTYTLTYTAGAGGTIAGTSSQTVNYGASGTQVTAVPNIGYTFAGWSDGVTNAARTDSNVNGNIGVTANFTINTYTLTYTAGAGGTITGASSQTVNYGASGTLVTAVPNNGYTFTGWSDGVTTAARTDSNVNGNIGVTANFTINTYTLTYTAGAGGTITGASSQTVNYGASGTLVTAVPNNGYTFTGWSDGVTTAVRTDTNVKANISVTANFTINTYTIIASAGTNGTISPSGTVKLNYGTNQVFTITPNAGYHVANALVDGVSVGAVTSYTFSAISANHTISASFTTSNSFTITASAGANGTISPSGIVTVNYGARQTFTITPNCGYRVATVLVDGISVGAVTRYTFNNVTANHTISASFTAYNTTFTITASAGANGTICPSGTVRVYSGRNQTFIITPGCGYSIAAVLVDGVSVGAVTSYTFTNVTANHTIAASFSFNNCTLTVNIVGSGTVTKSPDQASYLPGTAVTLTATPAAGWTFSGWQGAVSDVTNTVTLKMNGNKTVTAVFTNQVSTLISLLIKHLVINWDKNSYNNSDDDNCRQSQNNYNQYLSYKGQDGDNDKNTQSKYIDYLKSRDNCAANDTSAASQQDSKNCEAAYAQYLQYSRQYGDNNPKTQNQYNQYLTYQQKCEVSCVPPTSASGDFYVYGQMKLPSGMKVADFQRAAVVTLTISNGTVQDSVVFSRGSSQNGTVWQYSGDDNFSGIGMNLENMSLWWAPDTGNYSGMAGFHISGDFRMPTGISGTTQPPQVTVTVQLTNKTGAIVRGGVTVLCNVSGQGQVWQYNAGIGWPSFPYDIPDTGN